MDIQRLLDQAIATPAPGAAPSTIPMSADGILSNPAQQAIDAKKASVAQASEAKKSAFGAIPDFYNAAAGLGRSDGLDTAGEQEYDLRTMNPGQLRFKYGSAAEDMIRNMGQATQEFARDNADRTRNSGEAAVDTIGGAVSGFAGGLANLGALGVGLVNDEAGAAVAGAVDSANEWLQSTQSNDVNAARRVQSTRTALAVRDSAARSAEDIANGESKLVSGLKQIGRDFVSSVSNSTDPTFLAQGTSEATGSLLAGSPIAAGLRRIGAAAMGGAVGVAADRARRVGGALAWPTAVAGLEGGGAYTGTVNEIMDMSFERLAESSESFRELVAGGMSQEEARVTVAGEAGRQAAAIQAPIGGVTGLLTRAFETPFRVPSITSAARNALINEPVEEALQSASGQAAQNYAIRENADADRSLTQDVGDQAAQGALFGMTSGGAVQAPGASAHAAKLGGRIAYQGARAAVAGAVAAGKPLFTALVERGDRILRQQEKASPVSDEAMANAAADLNATAPVAAETMAAAVNTAEIDEAAKAAGNEYVSSLVRAMQVDPAELEGASDAVRRTLEGATSRAEALTRLARVVNQATTDNDILAAASELYFMMEPVRNLQEADPTAFDNLPKDHPALPILQQYKAAVANVENTPTVQRALRAVNSMMAKAQAEQLIQPVTEQSIGTPAGQQNVQNALVVAALHPDKGNLAANEQILTHAKAGRLNLTPAQLKTLEASTNLLRARQKMEKQIAASGIRRAKDVVSSQIVAGNDPLRKDAKSALQHTKEILSAVNSQNIELGTARLEDFGKFVQHMQNKVGALNTHFSNGNPNADGVQYQQLQPSSREFKLSKDGVFVNTNKGASIDQAQSIALEAEILADVYNGLVATFPELGQAEIPAVALDAALVGDAEELSKKFRAARVSPAAPPKLTPKPAVEQPKVEEVKNDGPVASERPDGVEGDSQPASQPVDRVESVVPAASPAVETDAQRVEPSRDVASEQLDAAARSADSEQPSVVNPLAELYGEKNYVRSSFTFPETPRTRLYAEDSPIVSVRRALSSQLRLNSFLSGSPSANTLTTQAANAYQRLLSDHLVPVLKAVESQLNDFLSEPYSKSKPKGPTIEDAILAGTAEINRWSRGKVINLTQQDENGRLSYQPQMLEQAALATMQWLLSAESFMSNQDEADIADMTGMSEAALQQNTDIIEQLTEGMSLVQAKRSLSQKIRNYWGLQASNTADLAYVEGIPDAMAAEMLRALDAAGLITLNTVKLTPDVHGVATPQDHIRVIPSVLEDADVLATYQDAIEVASLVEPEHTNYIGDVVPAVAQRQMNNNEVANTQAQKDALTKEQQTPFYVNPAMVSFYASMGKDNLLSLFGTPMSDTDVYNDNHLKTVEGRNKSVTAAFDHLFAVMADVGNAAAAAGIALDQTPIRYAYNMSRVGRMQMLGKYSPQASKLMREAILPTRSTLDLTNENSDQFAAYGLGLAQALGIKVHNQPTADSVTQVMAMLNGPLAPAVEIVRDWLGNTDLSNPTTMTAELSAEAITALKAAYKTAGADLTFVGLHAVVDYARFLAADDRSAFNTSVYLEADGVTNGPINAMALMSIGPFSQEWVSNIAKGGLTFGPPATMADIRRNDSKDLYQASTDAARTRLTELRNSLSQEGNEQMDHLLGLMSLFNKDVLFDPNKAWEDGSLELKRGIAKNPLTITIYGSGEAGIAGKLTSSLVSEIYARMSTLLQSRKANSAVSVADAMFPGDADAANKLAQFGAAIRALTTKIPESDGQSLSFDIVNQPSRKFNPKTFSFTASELEVMEKNMLELFVKPMRAGITDTVGEPLMKAVAVLRDAAQVQSVFLESLYLQRVDEAMAEKEKNDSTWRRGDFLSRADLNKISASLRSIAPLVQTGDQSFMISGQQAIELEGRDLEYGRALNDTLRTDPSIYAPAQAGVRAIPMMTIGMGDGMMMQLLAQAGLQGTLKIFDGMNMPLDKIREYSQQSNAAVFESWKGNPHAEMLKTFDTFMKNVTADTITEAMKPSLIQTLFEAAERRAFRKEGAEPSNEQIMGRIARLRGNLAWAAKSIDARHAAVDSMPVSLDQMAAAAQPFTNGRTAVVRMSDAQAAQALNTAYQYAMKTGKMPAPAAVAPVQAPVPAQPTPAIEKMGRVMSQAAIDRLAKSDMTEAQRVIYNEIRRSLAAKDYKVVSGTPAQLDAYITEKGLSERPGQDVHGWINIGDKTVFLVNPTAETLVHELVHAASFETLLTHYQGGDLGTNAQEIRAAIGRLETMKDEFLKMDDAAMDPALRAAYDSARAAILSSNLEVDQAVAQAKALNEFMAWGLTNEQLTKDLKQKQAPALVQMAKNVIKAIKQLIWGRKIAPKAADDFLSNLQFNAGVVIRSQPSIAAVVRDGELFHSTAYGNSNRLTAVRQAFGQKIVDLIATDKWQRGVKMRTTEVSEAQMMAIDVAMSVNANGFPMTPQENLTFRMIVAALATEAEIDTNALARAQELYAHVTKNLRVESFMADPESLDNQMRYDAQQQYNTIMGVFHTPLDAKGRSSMLPAFLGLATVSDEFRAVLAKMPLPASLKNNEGTLDAVLENAGTTALDSLSRRLAGDAKSDSVRKSVDNLMEHIRQVAQDEQTFLDQYAAKTGGLLDRANDLITEKLEAASDALLAKTTAAEKNASNALVRSTARVGQLFAAVVSEKNGAKVAEGVMAGLNASKVWEPLRTFIGDLVGRTSTNANVYDMIKAVRSQVQQARQQFREGVPLIINEKFKKKLSAREWTAMFNALGKTDIALLRQDFSHAQIADLVTDANARDAEINKLEALVQGADRRHWPIFERKMKQLANFMNTGVAGVNLLRNAEAIARLLNEKKANNFGIPNAATRKAIDQLVTLYALEGLSEADRSQVASLVQGEAEGVNFVVDYLVGQRKEEARKSVGNALLNAYKGYVPSEQEAGISMQVADDTEFTKLRELGYVRVGAYNGSSIEMYRVAKSYYLAPLPGRAVFNQGIMQNVRQTAGGVDAVSGFTNGMTAGRITGKQQIARLLARMSQEKATAEALMPVFDKSGQVIALERAVDPLVTSKLNKSTDLAKMIGVWRGRQSEEAVSHEYNKQLVDRLKSMYDEDMKVSSANKAQYVNLLSSKVAKDNPVIADAVGLFTNETLAYIKDVFGDEFMVRRDMIRDAIGERSASVGDLWNGITTIPKDHQEHLRKALVGAFGVDAYRYMVQGEQIIQNFMADMRTLIVVKSVIVPAVNFVSNVYQLVGRGVPMLSIARGMPAKVGEIDSYAKTQLRKIEAEAELRAATGDVVATRKLKTEIQSIEDSHRRLSIWPLLEAGEFSSIADVGMQGEDLDLTSGKLSSFIERQVDKLPDGVKTAGRYALITKDTALYRGLQKSVQYGDFIAKAVLYDDLTKRVKMSKADALARITEEFVNYDRLPGRFRSYLENMGLLWFYNFKIRSTKVALSTIRNNPVHALLAMGLPAPDFLGSVGSPISDNIAAKALGDTLGSSVGTDMAFRAPTLNPWLNLIH